MSKKIKLIEKSISITEHDKSADLFLYGYIGDDLDSEAATAENFVSKLNYLASKFDRIDIRLNSFGGSFFHGNAMITAVQQCKKDVHIWIDGMAASMAADLFLAATKENRHIGPNSLLMIHATLTYVYGNAEELRKQADVLDKFDDGPIAMLAKALGKTTEEIKSEYYDGEDHWLSAQELEDLGFVSKIEDYETNTPVNATAMTTEQIKSYYRDFLKSDDTKPSLAKEMIESVVAFFSGKDGQKLIAQAEKKSKKETDMSIEELKKSIADRTLNIKDVQAAITPEPTPTETETPMEKALAEIAEMKKQLKASNEQVKKALAAAKKLPGAGVEPQAGSDGEPTPETKTELQKFNEKMEKAARNGDSISLI